MQKTAYLTDSVEQFKTLFSETIERIDALLNALRARGDKALVERLSAEVEQQGELDPYWAAKLNMMLDLELI